MTARLGPVVRATAQDTRSQTRNRELALQRLRARLASALVVQRPRRPDQADGGRAAQAAGRQAPPQRAQAGAAAAGAGEG